MEYKNFLNVITSSTNNIFTAFKNIFSYLLNNNFFKTIIFIILIYFIIENFEEIIKVIKNIFSMKKESAKNKVNNSNDIE